MKYLWVEVALCLKDDDFWSNTEIYEKIVGNPRLKELGFTEVIGNGLVNTLIDRTTLILNISYLLFLGEDYYPLILKLFQAPTTKHIELVIRLVSDKEVVESSHIEEMIDMIYKTHSENLEELEFKITHKLVYEEMLFKDACQNYLKEAMQILDENDNIKPKTRVRVPIYKKRC